MTSVQTDLRCPSDAELITSSRAGDEVAYAALYERHLPAARAAARALTRSRSDADDVVAEAFMRVLQALRRGGGPEVAFRPYLLTAVRNAFYDRVNRAKREELTDDQEDRPSLFGVDIVAGEDQKLVAAAFAQLPERWQLVLWHTEVEGKSPADVAPLLGLAPNAVAALAYRAREGLRQAYLQAHLQRQVPERCRPFANKLGAYARDGLATRDRRKVDEHLAECERCAALVAELSEVNHSLRGVLIPILLGVPAASYLSHLGGGMAIVTRLRPHVPKNPAFTALAAGVAASVVAVAGFAVIRATSSHESSASSSTVAVTAAPNPAGTSAATTVTAPGEITTTVPTTVAPAPSSAAGGATNGAPANPTSTGTTTATTAATTATETTTATTTATTTPETTAPETTVPETTAATTAPPVTTPPTTAPPVTTPPTTAPPVTAPPTTAPPVTTTTVVTPPLLDYTVAGQFVGPVVAGGTAGLQVDLTVATAPGGPGASVAGRALLPAQAAGTTEIRLALPEGVVFAAIDDGWTCTEVGTGTERRAVCASPSLEKPGNASILVRVSVGSALTGTIQIPYEIVTSDGRHISGDPATATITSVPDAVYAGVDHSGLALAGNSLMSCNSDEAGCAEAQSGLGPYTDKQHWSMVYVDVDDDPATFNSSRSDLALPAGANVQFAGLRWSGDSGPKNGSGTVLLTDPSGARRTVTADSIVTEGLDIHYISMADVTDVVRGAGSGTYTVANVAASTGNNRYAGWGLVVVYRLESAPARLVLVRDTNAADPWTIVPAMSATIDGLPAVVDARNATVAVVAFNGNLDMKGDSITANGTPLANSENPFDNVLNSSIALGIGRDPSHVNTFGTDVDSFDATLPVREDHPEDATAVTFTFAATGDKAYLATIGLVVDLKETAG